MRNVGMNLFLVIHHCLCFIIIAAHVFYLDLISQRPFWELLADRLPVSSLIFSQIFCYNHSSGPLIKLRGFLRTLWPGKTNGPGTSPSSRNQYCLLRNRNQICVKQRSFPVKRSHPVGVGMRVEVFYEGLV